MSLPLQCCVISGETTFIEQEKQNKVTISGRGVVALT